MVKLPISVCYLVRNEEAFLEESLRSVASFASEIIVVDTGSGDRTVDIAKQFTSQIYSFTWQNDFAKARNFAAQKASQKWILFVDGDEILEQNAAQKIEAFVADDFVHAYSVVQRNYSESRNIIGWVSEGPPAHIQSLTEGCQFAGYVDNIMYKLYRNNLGISWDGVVHETIIHSCRKLGLRWEETSIVFHHLSEAKKPEFKFKKKKYYLDLALEKLKQDSNHENPWFELAICFCNLGIWAEGEKAFAEAIRIRPTWNEAKLMRAQTLLQLERFSEAELVLRELLETSFHFEDVLAYLSTALLYQRKYEECLKIIEAGESIGLKHPHFHINAATLLFELKEYLKCRGHLEKARDIVPHDIFVQESLVKVDQLIESPMR